MPNKSVSEALASVFDRIREQRVFTSAPGSQLSGHIHEACVSAAMSKCVDFNVIVNRDRSNTDEAFILLCGLRGIVEDLIVLKYLLSMPDVDRESYLTLLLTLNWEQGILAQRQFFEANNPFQLVVGSNLSADEAKKHVEKARSDLRVFWKGQGGEKKVKEMANSIGLTKTYEYVYFAASNFVHFNPHALMRTGWGPAEGPFTFSVGSFDGYYRDLAMFYGAILYVGFASTFGDLMGTHTGFEKDISDIEDILMKVHRWPELVTFEELNIKAPLHILLHALREGTRERDPDFEFASILKEVKGL